MTSSIGSMQYNFYPTLMNSNLSPKVGACSPQVKPQPKLEFFSDKKQYNPKRTWGDYLAIGTTSLSIVGNLLLFASPWLSKSVKEAPQRFNPRWLRNVLSPVKHDKLLNTLKDKQALANFFQSKVSNVAYLLQQNTGIQTGFHTQQPTKIYGSAIVSVILLFGLVKYKPILDSVQNLASFLWLTGESNDIHNNVDPAHRREWDPKRLRHPFSKAPDGSKTMFESAIKSFKRDCAYPLSLKPWREMYSIVKNYKHTDWLSPKSCETAIGAQLQLVTFFGLIASYLLNEHGKNFCKEATARLLSKSLTLLSKYAVLASAISFVPITLRAWQNRGETTSLLTLAGVPLAAIYQVLQASPLTLDTRKGLFVIGFPLINEGNLCNSKHYRNQVDYLKFIYSKAIQNPQLKAADFLNYLQTNRKEMEKMTKAMGLHRVTFILQILQNAQKEQIKNNTTLGLYLRPMMQENGTY